MILIPLAVMWAGYTLFWTGLAYVKGPGIGMADLVIPSRSGKVDSVITSVWPFPGTIFAGTGGGKQLTPDQQKQATIGGNYIQDAQGKNWTFNPASGKYDIPGP